MTNSGTGDKDGPFYGSLPLNMSFNAGASEGNGLSYAWTFGDGATATGASVSHTFEQEGLFPVKLTVTDTNGLKDSYTQFVRTTKLVNDTFFMTFSMLYPESSVSTSATARAQAELLKVEEGADGELEAKQSSYPVIQENFPFVILHNSAANTRPNSFLVDHGGFECAFSPTFNYDRYYDMTVNGTVIGSDFYLVNHDYWNPNNPYEGGLCDFAIIKREAVNPLLLSRSESEIRVATPLQDFRYKIDNIAEVRVPRVFVTVLPDAMIPGEVAGPYIEQHTITNAGKTEMMMTVSIRESEAQSFAEFDVPVYGVDRNGALASSASGYFNATFAGLETSCDDCVMVNGVSQVTVKVPLGGAAGNDVEFSLDRVRLSRDGTCSNDSTSPLRGYLSGCVTVDAGHEVFANAPPMEPFAYTLPPEALSRSGAVTLGASEADRDLTWANFGNGTLEVAKFGINFIPFLSDGGDLLGQIYNSASGKGADPVISTLSASGLILDVATGGFGDFTAGIKGVYKLSLQSNGFFSAVIKTSVSDFVTSGRSAREIIDGLSTQFNVVSKLFFNGGLNAVRSADQLAKGLSKLPCPVSASSLSALAGCSPAEISGIVARVIENATTDGVGAQLNDSLIKVCCSLEDGGSGYIKGAENLVERAAQGSANVRNLEGVISEAKVGDSLRSSGFNDLEYPSRNSYTAPGGGQTEPDLIGFDTTGQKRVIEVKTGSLYNDEQIANLLFVANQIEGSPKPSIVSVAGLFPDILEKAVDAGIDVLDVSGNVIALGRSNR